MTARILDNQIRGILIFVLFFILLLNSCFSNAQTGETKKSQRLFCGFETAFGTRSFTVMSDIAAIKDLFVIQEGGRAGVVAGTRIIKTRLSFGFYYSGGSVPYTFEKSEASASIILNPLSLFHQHPPRFEPYLVGGIVHHTNKLYGHYLSRDGKDLNYSRSEQPFIGRISKASATIGLGFEYKFTSEDHFVHLFTEARYGKRISQHTKHSALSGTYSKNNMMIELGIRFGASR